jgi:hypothetical protein
VDITYADMGGIVNKKHWASQLMFMGGIAELVIALLHFLMPLQLVHTEIGRLSDDYRSFVLLGVIAIGLCLAIFGALSIYFSRRLLLGEEGAWIFGLSQGILWMGRTVFELVLPVRIPLFIFPNPTTLILPLALSLALLFLTPLLIFRAEWLAVA